MIPNPARAVPALLASLLALGATACGRGELPSGYGEVSDLVADLQTAAVRQEVAAIDIGTPEARPHLASFWSWDESTTTGRTFVWAVGSASAVRFFLVAPRDLTLRLRGRPFVALPGAAGAEAQTVAIEINGQPVERFTMEPGPTTYTVTLPAAALVAGDNRLTLRHGRAQRPAALGLSSDDRALAAAWEELRFAPVAEPTEPPRPLPGDGTGRPVARLPFGSGIDVYVRIPSPRASGTETRAGRALLPVLVVEALRTAGGNGALAIEIQEEGLKTLAAGRIEPGGRCTVFRLPLSAGAPGARLVRVGLRAVPNAPGERGALELVAPRLLARTLDSVEDARAPLAGNAEAGGARPNVLVYLVDTLRADRLGAYGDSRGLTPAIDAFAAEAVVFEDGVAQAPWTRPAVTSLLTGLGPLDHGVTTLDDRLADEAETLPEVLRRAGYRTAGFSTNLHVTAETGLAQGFGEFIFTPDDVRADAVNRRVVTWLDEHRAGPHRDEPFFLYVHTLDPHAPYQPPEPFRSRHAPRAPAGAGSLEFLDRIYAATTPESRAERARLMATVRDLYDGEVAFADHAFGELLRALRARGLYDDTLVVFLSDHGEELDEHGHLGHGKDLYREVLQVPFIVRLPGGERPNGRARVEEVAQQIDLLPTLLARLGVEAPAPLRGTLEGVDLFAPPSGPARPRPAFSHLDYEGVRALAITLGRWRATLPLSESSGRWTTLFDRSRDPAELDDLSGGPWRARGLPVRTGYLETLLRRRLLTTGKRSLADKATLDEKTRKGLEALGYL